MNRHYHYISLLKLFAMLAVVLLHSSHHFEEFSSYWPYKANEPDVVVSWMSRIFACMVVPGFFMASGFLITRTVCVGHKSWSEQVLGRSKRLLLPFFATGILYLVPVYTLLDLASFNRPAGSSWLEGYTAFFQGKFADHLWFLSALFWCSLIFMFMAPLLRSRKLVWVAAGIAVFLAWVNTVYMSNIPWYSLSQLARPLVMMALGALLCHYHDVQERMGKWSVLPGALILTAGILAEVFWTEGAVSWHCRNVLCTLGIALVLYGVVGETPCRLQQSRVGKWFEKNSMLFYLLHSPFPLICFSYIYMNSEWVQSWPGMVYVAVFFPLAVLCTVVLTIAVGKGLNLIFPPKQEKAKPTS